MSQLFKLILFQRYHTYRPMIDMSIQVKNAQYLQKRKALARLQRQVKKSDQIDQKLKLILKSDIAKIESLGTQKTHTQNVFQNEYSNIDFFSQQFFSGKLYTAWIFILKKIPSKTLQKIEQMQKQLQKDRVSSIIPFTSTFKGALRFFRDSKSYFKILIDLDNAEKLVDYVSRNQNDNFLSKIAEIHIYSDNSDGKNRYDAIRNCIKNNKKVIQLLYEIDCKLQDIRSYLLNCRRFIIQNGQITTKNIGYRYSNMLPAYMKLSDEDKTQVTKYRLNLYRLINLKDERQSSEMFNIFQKFIRRVYEKNKTQNQFLDNYINLKESNQFGKKQALEFYSGETFYYQVTNTMLRVSHQIEDFKLIATPFIELYRAIKHFYQIDKKKYHKNFTQSFSLYRGAPFNIRKVKVGQYIELLGFVSTSKKKQVAKGFLKRDSCLIEIRIPSHVFESQRNQDHGFVDFNSNINAAHPEEQQFLINALNILKVIEIIPKEESNQNLDSIVLQYGAIFQLEKRKIEKPLKLSLSEQQVLMNFEYCKQKMTEIKDQIDLLISTQQYDKASQKLEKKIYVEKQKTDQIMIKYAQVLYQTGEKTKSSNIARNVLSKFLQSHQSQEEKQKQIEKLQKHAQKITQIFKADDDNVSAKKVILKQIEHIDNEKNPMQKAFKIYELSLISFQQGKIKESESYLLNAFKIVSEIFNAEDQNNSQQKTHLLGLRIIIFLLKIYNHIGDHVNIVKWHVQGLKIYNKFQNLLKNNQTKQNNLSEIKLWLTKYSIQKVQSQKTIQLLVQVLKKQEQINPVNEKVAELTVQLAIIKAQELVNNISQPQEKQDLHGKKEIKFSESQVKRKTLQVEEKFDKCIQIYSYRQGKDHPKVLEIRNKRGQFEYQRGDVVKSIEQSKIVIDAQKLKNTKIKAKAVLILGKDYFYTGEILKSFQTVELAIKILQVAIIKKQNDPLYREEFHLHQIYVQSKILKIKLFNKQLKHDLALKTISEVQKIAQQKLTNVKAVSYTANLLQEKGNTFALIKKVPQAIQCFKEAILLRKKQSGHKKIINGICYCTIAKYHIFYQNFKQANKSIMEADQIFSQFPINSPNNWVLSFVKSYFYQKTNNGDKEKQQILRSSQLVQKRYGPDHINYLLVKIREAKILQKNAKNQQDYEIIKQKLDYLYGLLENDRSICQFHWNNAKIQNEKVELKQQVYRYLSQTEYKLSKSISSNLMSKKKFVSMSQIKQSINIKTMLKLKTQKQLSQLNTQKKISQQTMAESQQTNQQLVKKDSSEHQQSISINQRFDIHQQKPRQRMLRIPID